MPLTLQPALTDLDRSAIEDHVNSKRDRRLTAAIMYQQGINAKLEAQHVQLERRIRQQSHLLMKDIMRFDKVDAQIQKRLEQLTVLMQNAGLISDLYIMTPEED